MHSLRDDRTSDACTARSQLEEEEEEKVSGIAARQEKAHAISSLSHSHNSRSVTSHQVFDWHEREGRRRTFVRHWEERGGALPLDPPDVAQCL